MKKLYKSKTNKVVSGIIGGLGEYFGVDATILRLLWILVTIFSGIIPALIVYILAILIVPDRP